MEIRRLKLHEGRKKMAYHMPQNAYSPWMGQNKMRDEHAPLAITRVVFQPQIAQVYNALEALKRGTLFPELDKPWVGKRGAY